MRRRRAATRAQRGFTLLELMIVVAILAIVATIGVPNYLSAVRTARIGKARHELVTIANAVDSYRAVTGALPLSLHLVGFGGKRDPWGVPYCYLNYADGSGDGLEWAIGLGLVDPAAFEPVTGSGGGGGDGGVGAPAANPQGQAGAVGQEYQLVEQKLGRRLIQLEKESIRSGLRDRGDFGLFLGVDAEQTRRRDRYMFPLNTDYDLFSLGPDTRTATSLGERFGLDDVIRANNGGFYGTAADY